MLQLSIHPSIYHPTIQITIQPSHTNICLFIYPSNQPTFTNNTFYVLYELQSLVHLLTHQS